MWNRVTERIRHGREFLPTYVNIENVWLKDNGQVTNNTSAVIQVSVIDDEVVSDLTWIQPEDGPSGVSKGVQSRFAEGGAVDSKSPLNHTFSPFNPEAVCTIESVTTRLVADEPVVQYLVSWVNPDGFKFNSEVWVSFQNELPMWVRSDLVESPQGSPIQDLRVVVRFVEHSGFPVEDSRSIEVSVKPSIFRTLNSKTTLFFSEYFLPPIEVD